MADEKDAADIRSRLRQWALETSRGDFDPAKPPLAGVSIDVLHASLAELSRDPAFIAAILGNLFPEGCPADLDTFYSRLTLWDTELPASPDAHRLLASVLAHARQTWPAEQHRLLEALNSPNHSGFFPMLDALPVFLAENELPERFAADWFVAIADRLRGDMGGGGFWRGLREFAAHFPPRALDVVDVLFADQPTAQSMWVAARLLGVARTTASSEAERVRLTTTETRWSSSHRPDDRLYFNRSWVSTAGERALTPTEFAALLGRVEQGSEKEFEDAFFVVTQCLASVKTPTEVQATGLDWLRKQASQALGPDPKFQIAAFVHNTGESQGDVDDLLWSIQPVALEHIGTWRLVETILVSRLKEVPNARFSKLFDGLANASQGAFAASFELHGVMERLPRELAQDKTMADRLLAGLLFSHSSHRRRLGLRLFERLPAEIISGNVFAGKNEAEVLLALLELRRSVPRPGAIVGLILLLAPYLATAGAELKREYADEVLVQAKNYPGACLKRFKAEAGRSIIIDAAVADAEAYVSALAAAGTSPLVKMEVPGFSTARREHQRRFQNDVMEGAKERSVFAQIFPEVHVLYGDQFAVDNGGDISGTPFNESSVQMEVPSLEFIDPEGMTLRRLDATRAIEKLEQGLATSGQPPPTPAP